MEPVQHFGEINGNQLCWFEWGERTPGEETIVLVHATGFHARCWDAVVRQLPSAHIVAIDQRGHGRSGNEGMGDWKRFGEDLTALITQLDLDNIVGVGHSMGGHAMVQAAAACSDRFARIVLFDPVIMSPEAYAAPPSMQAWMNDAGEHPVARRKNLFNSWQAFYDNLHGRGSYATWQDECLKDYCEYGVEETPEGFVLCCPPRVEAGIYLGSTGKDIADLFEDVTVPALVVRAKAREEGSTKMDFSVSPTWAGLADSLPMGVDAYRPDLTHFIPRGSAAGIPA